MRSVSSIHPRHFGLFSGTRPLGKYRRRGYGVAWDGHFAPHKALGPSPFHSLLERDVQTLLSADPRVRLYAVEPHVLTYSVPDDTGAWVKRQYTPDLVTLDRDDRVTVLDAKSAFLAGLPKWKKREHHIREAYEQDHGVRFVVLTECEIRQEPRLSNCKIMLRHRGPPDDAEAEILVRSAVCALRETTIEAIAAEAGFRTTAGYNRTFTAVMRLALKGEIAFDLSAPLSRSTLVTAA